jgi:hypothetical protein
MDSQADTRGFNSIYPEYGIGESRLASEDLIMIGSSAESVGQFVPVEVD